MEQEAKHAGWKKNQTPTNRIATTRLNAPDKEPNNDFYPTRRVFIMQKATID